MKVISQEYWKLRKKMLFHHSEQFMILIAIYRRYFQTNLNLILVFQCPFLVLSLRVYTVPTSGYFVEYSRTSIPQLLADNFPNVLKIIYKSIHIWRKVQQFSQLSKPSTINNISITDTTFYHN